MLVNCPKGPRKPRHDYRLVLVLLVGTFAALRPNTANAHGIKVPWIERAAADEKGVFLSLDGPTRIRKWAPITLHVTVLNAHGHAAYELTNLELVDSSSSIQVSFQPNVVLDTQAKRVAALRALLSSAPITTLRDPEHLSLAQAISDHAVHWRARLEEDQVHSLFELSSTARLRVRATLLINEELHVTEDALILRKLSPLPDGRGAGTAWRWNRTDGVLEAAELEQEPAESRSSPMYWFAGDQHVHSQFSLDVVILGHLNSPDHDPAPITEFGDAARSLDLDWIIITDHSNVHITVPLEGEFYTADQFEQGRQEASTYSAGHSDITVLYSQEMGVEVDPADPRPAHLLVYPYLYSSTGFIPNPSSGGECSILEWSNYQNCQPAQAVFDLLQFPIVGGMGFIAHPFSSGGCGVFRPWTGWDTGYAGLEIWSNKYGEFEDTDVAAWDHWRFELLGQVGAPTGGALPERPGFPNRFPVALGNSDAHRTSLLGNTFTHCWMADPGAPTYRQILDAIADGHCTVSNGPLLWTTLNDARVGEVAVLTSIVPDLIVRVDLGPDHGTLSEYDLRIFVDGTQRGASIPLSGGSLTTVFLSADDLSLSPADRHIIARVDRDNGTYRAITNPIWLEWTDPCEDYSCTPWQQGACGGGNCAESQRLETRSCTPDGCAEEARCVFDQDCVDPGGGGDVTPCDNPEPGYEFCVQYVDSHCDARIAVNYYSNVNNIRWGAVVDTSDPFVIGEYRIGWRDVEAIDMYMGVCNNDDACLDGDGFCAECDGEPVPDEDTRVMVQAPGIAYAEAVLGYDEDGDYCCWVCKHAFTPSYNNGQEQIYVLSCFDDSDCGSTERCDKLGQWSEWACVPKVADGGACTTDSECESGFCDNDGVGLEDDGWCFTPVGVYFDGQESGHCEFSTSTGSGNCDEREVGEGLSTCIGLPYREDACGETCSEHDITDVFECNAVGCACEEPLCDGLASGDSIGTCASGLSYFADACSATAGGSDRNDNICRSEAFASACTGAPECDGVVAGTGNCSLECQLACGDGVCEVDETCASCIEDCGYPLSCDDGVCEPECGENNADCPGDCGCGDGIVDVSEYCDDGGESVTCDDDCSVVECGDGNVNEEAGEYCDDGNSNGCDGCDSECIVEECGNDSSECSEACDGTDDVACPGLCQPDCTCERVCGDGGCDPNEDRCNCREDCGLPPSSETNCSDGIDNDCDSLIDGADLDCDPCGNGTCDIGEDRCNCPQDCGLPPLIETTCFDAIDNDCDGQVDSADRDCLPSLIINIDPPGAAPTPSRAPHPLGLAILVDVPEPHSGFCFDHWSGEDVEGRTDNPLEMVLDRDRTITAEYRPRVDSLDRECLPFLTINIDPPGAAVRPDPVPHFLGVPILVDVPEPFSGFCFDRWSGEEVEGSTDNPVEIVLDRNRTVTAHYLPGTSGDNFCGTGLCATGPCGALAFTAFGMWFRKSRMRRRRRQART